MRLLIPLLLLASPARAATGGPDAYGYTWSDSDEPGGPAYDSGAVPGSASIGLCNDEWYTVPILFDFEFYGSTYNQVSMSANGALYLVNSTVNSPNGGDATNACPITAATHPRIAALWDDWFANDDYLLCGGSEFFIAPSVGWTTVGSSPNRQFHFSWVNNPHNLCAGSATWTVKLFEADGAIEFHYQDPDVSGGCTQGGTASVGISDSSLNGGSALTVTCNTASAIPAGYAVRFEAPGGPGCVDADGDLWESDACGGTDCDDADPDIHPFALEACNGLDDDCDGSVSIPEQDGDGDGVTPCDGDCDDGDSGAYPGADELCNGADDDCDGTVDEGFDPDGDGWGECTLFADCWEGDPATHPGAPEIADGVDNDCDGDVDEGTDRSDDDGDGFSELAGDCDDGDDTRAPGLPELLNAEDDDCDGLIDEGTLGYDDDGDGVTELDGDCHDGDPAISPLQPEVDGNGLDDDCDGVTDLGGGGVDADGDGFAVDAGDCDDDDEDVHPAAVEIPNTLDDDCDGTTDEGTELYDDDGDGYTELQGDCDDSSPGTQPAADETGNGRDDDCDGAIDEGTASSDDDGDGFTEEAGDCDDEDADVHPAAEELGNGVDDDCDGRQDEGTDAWDNDGDGLSAQAGDCDDEDPWNHPEREEACGDEQDNDCDGEVDEDCTVELPPSGEGDGCSAAVGGRAGPFGALLLLLPLFLRRLPAATRGLPPLLALLLLAGCSDVSVSRGLGDLRVTPSVIDLGATAPGSTVELVVSLDNVGSASLSIASASVQSGDAVLFEVLAETPISLQRGEGAAITVTYRPELAGLHEASLVVNSDAGDQVEVLVRGRAADPTLNLWPLLLDFGEGAGVESVTLHNDSPVPTTISALELTDAAFSVQLPPSAGELPSALPAGGSLTLQVSFDPPDDAPAEAVLRVVSDAPQSPFLQVQLLGNLACSSAATAAVDEDGDGLSPCGGDCDDGDPSVWAGAPEFLDGEDNDCDGTIDEGTVGYDDDGDGVTELDGDCDDTNPDTWPGADEELDGLDNDCDGAVDDGTPFLDDDGDGFSDLGGDCDDEDPGTNPAAVEIANGQDDDCDGLVDEGTAVYDDDGDGITELAGDCHDGDADVFPGATELANGRDDDCDGSVDEGTAWGDDDGDGFNESGGDCDDADAAVHPAAEELPGVPGDENCDGVAE